MRVLVIRPGALGDVLLTLPALQCLSAAFPQASIELMGNLSVLEWLPGRSVPQRVSSFDRADLATLFLPEPGPAAVLGAYLDSFDLILSYVTAPEHLFARNLARLSRGRLLSLDTRPPEVQGHMSAYLQRPLEGLGIALCTGYPALKLTSADYQEAGHWWKAHALEGRDVIAVHPGSGSRAKNWPAARFAAVARRLQQERSAGILLVAGPADEMAVAEVLQQMDGGFSRNEPWPAASATSARLVREVILLRDLPFPLLAAVLTRCQVYLGNDSGISHLAAASGVPTVAVFGPTDPEVWAPRGPAVRVVRSESTCAPCTSQRRQACPQRVCLEAVSTEAVLDAIATLAVHG